MYGETVRFGLGGDSHRFCTTGWSFSERGFVWNDGPAASLTFSIAPPQPPTDLLLTIKLGPMLAPPDLAVQPVDVYAHGEKVASWQVTEEGVYTAEIPQHLTIRGYLNIDLHMPKAIAPAEVGLGSDARRLAIRCFELKLDLESNATAPAP
ncbi:MAG: hypothetical protein ABR589_00120 [Chthoniobacterales bacterium]